MDAASVCSIWKTTLTPGAFYLRELVDSLTLLSGQIAVSIDNAMMYEKLEQKVIERTAELDQEKRRTDDLLHNILPAETAVELKRHGRAEARHYARVTVLFTDFEGFTGARRHSRAGRSRVRELDDCFNAFDVIVTKRGVEKIKTIGDAFMAVGGLPGAELDASRGCRAGRARDARLHRGIRRGGVAAPTWASASACIPAPSSRASSARRNFNMTSGGTR